MLLFFLFFREKALIVSRTLSGLLLAFEEEVTNQKIPESIGQILNNRENPERTKKRQIGMHESKSGSPPV